MMCDAKLPARIGMATCLGLMLLLAGSCGGLGSGSSSGALVGGVLRPRPTWYALAPTSDPLVPVAGSCLVADEGEPLPGAVDLRRDSIIPPVQNQRWNSCVAWSFAYYVMSAVEARRVLNEAMEREGVAALDMKDPANWFSPDFLYSQRDTHDEREFAAPEEPRCFELDRDEAGRFELGCMRPEKALRLLIERGACKWPWMCLETATNQYGTCAPIDRLPVDGPLDVALAAANFRSRRAWQPSSPGAELFKPECYVRFGPLNEIDPQGLPLTTDAFPLGDMKAWLHEQGTPIAIVVQMTAGWLNFKEPKLVDAVVRRGFPCDVIEKRGVCLKAAGEDLGSQHMMTIIGYDDAFPSRAQYPDLPNEKRGSFLVINQWGDKWGHDGVMWIPYTELRKIWIGGYGIIGARPGTNVRQDGITRTACGVLEGGCDVEVIEPCTQDLEGRWVDLAGEDGRGDDVPLDLGVAGDIVTNPNARQLQLGAPALMGNVGGGTDPGDWFYFDVPANTAIELTLIPSAAGQDPDMKLTDANQRRIGASTNRGFTSDHIQRLLCNAGRYYVKVYPFDPSIDSSYTLSLAAPLVPMNPDDDICGATPITLTDAPLPALPIPYDFTGKPGDGAQAQGVVGPDDGCDWWAVTNAEAPIHNVTLVAAEGVRMDAWRGPTPDTATLVARAVRPIGDWKHVHASVPGVVGEGLFLRVSYVGAPNRFDAQGYTLDVRAASDADTDDWPAGATPLPFAPDANDPTLWRAATPLPPAALPERVGEEDPLDYYRFTAPAGANVTVTITDITPGRWVVASRVGAGGRAQPGFPLSWDVPADGGCEPVLLAVTVPPVNQRGDILASTYTLTVEVRLGEDPATDDNVDGNARTLGVGQPHCEVVGGADAEDWFRLDPPGDADAVILTLTDFCAELQLDVVTGQGDAATPVVVSDAGDAPVALVRRLDLANGQAGPFWVRVASPTGATSGYVLRLAEANGNATPGGGADGNNTPQTAQADLPFGGSVQGLIDFTDARDYWRVRIPGDDAAPVRVSIRLTDVPDGADHRLTAWDQAGRLLGSSDNAGNQDEALALTVPAGTEITVLVDEGPTPSPPGTYLLTVEAGP